MRLVNKLGVPISISDLGLDVPTSGLFLSSPLRRIAKSKQIVSLVKKDAISISLSDVELSDPHAYLIHAFNSHTQSSSQALPRNPARAYIRDTQEPEKKEQPPSLLDLPQPQIEIADPPLRDDNVIFRIDELANSQVELLKRYPQVLDISSRTVSLAMIRSALKLNTAGLLKAELNRFSSNAANLTVEEIVAHARDIRTGVRGIGEFDGVDVGIFSMGGLGDDIVRANSIRTLKDNLPWDNVFITYYHRSSTNLLSGLDFINLDVPLGSRSHESDSLKVEACGEHDIFIDLRYIGKISVQTGASFSSLKSGKEWERLWGKAFRGHPSKIRPIAKKYPIHYCELLPKTLGVSFDKLDLDFTSFSSFPLLETIPRPFVVISNGTDQALETGRQTKQLDVNNLAELCAILMSRGWNIVEVGLQGVERTPILGIYDLIGKTSFHELCSLLKESSGVICNEGGVAHLASALRVPSVVGFGPTSRTFWGYPQNENVCSGTCTDCWLTSDAWYLYCPRKNYICMRDLTAELLLDSFERLCERYEIADASKSLSRSSL